ncbi:MAG: hypothetical protein IPJ65_35610 [Archangiaceae bacterium]|nr:hypothetical protein [Archangiaceae bacterium]
MKSALTTVAFFAVLAGCDPVEDELGDPGDLDPSLEGPADDVELADAEDLVSSEESALRHCYCRAPYACVHSSSPSHMYSGAHWAMRKAGVSDSSLIQTYGDVRASVGTHCPESGTTWSAATDIASGSSPCARTRALRRQGFAAWYRVPPSFSRHIHAVYAGAPEMKQSLKNQVASFLQGRNGLASNGVDSICPITAAEKAAVIAAREHRYPCSPGGLYCGTDVVWGYRNTLYRCNSNHTASAVRSCRRGCDINPSGIADACR